MENNYETLRMPELKALAREHRLRGYSQLRKAELIAFLQNNEQRQQRPPSPPPQISLGALLGNQIDLHKCPLGNWNNPN